ncbi:hypothetical protein NQZ68_028531 [Dissostichus eleginoides]|nr:hypothetical protein NQZ68_028531 [Dissostichus eleginoides]
MPWGPQNELTPRGGVLYGGDQSGSPFEVKLTPSALKNPAEVTTPCPPRETDHLADFGTVWATLEIGGAVVRY